MVKVLHIITDDKFSDDVINEFEQVNSIENYAVLLVRHSDRYRFKYIKRIEKIQLVENKDLIRLLKRGAYDIVFFHSLPVCSYKYVVQIPEDKKVIWWCWGYDIYYPARGMPPLINIPLYKSLTQRVLVRNNIIKLFLMRLIIAPYYIRLRSKVISRIDYFQPVLPLEYQLMLNVSGFRAKEFYYPGCFKQYGSNHILYNKNDNGGILIGNSPTWSNNHLDVWNSVKMFIPTVRKVIIPLNYVGQERIADKIGKHICSTNHNLVFVRDFLPRNEYFEMLDECSYAIFGVMRQQAMGNIYYCLAHGMKVFLYRDSIVYRFLRSYGFVVYTIEDIDDSSFVRTLSKIEAEKNGLAFAKMKKYITSIQHVTDSELLK